MAEYGRIHTDGSRSGGQPLLLPCPFCGAQPHHGLSKVMHDGLHGDPYQRFLVWCPKDHAKVDKVNREQAFAAWNTRQPTQSDALREALEAAPLIGRTESVYDFMERQDAWLKGPYRAAMEEQSE
jgi:hypothetical protein